MEDGKWYVIAETVPGVRSWYGAFKDESEADSVAEKVNGVAIRIKDWKKYAEIMNETSQNKYAESKEDNPGWMIKGVGEA